MVKDSVRGSRDLMGWLMQRMQPQGMQPEPEPEHRPWRA